MGLLDFIKNLFGGGDAPPPAPPEEGEAPPAPPTQGYRTNEATVPSSRAYAAMKDDEPAEEEEEEGGDDWGAWDSSDLEGFWDKVFAIEDAQVKGDDAAVVKMREYGLSDAAHFYRVRETFNRAHASKPEWMQAMMNARTRQTQAKMQGSAASRNLLEPIEGVSIEIYATICARRAGMQGKPVADIVKMLGEYDLDEPKFQRVDRAWQDRMRGNTDDPYAAGAIAMEFGKHFAAAQQGKLGAAGGTAAKGLGLDAMGAQTGTAGEPCTFERYCEIMIAQECWGKQGRDVTQMLKQVFSLTPLDWSNMGAYWSQKMITNVSLATKMNDFRPKYLKRYEAAGGADDDLSV